MFCLPHRNASVRLAGLLSLTLSALTPASAQTYDLQADWSDAQNPNGPWSYRSAGSALPAQPCWASSPPNCQMVWAFANSGQGHIPAWMRITLTPDANSDWQTGDIICHSDDFASGGTGDANVAWTSPICGTVDISGAVWLARNIGRSNDWFLRVNNFLLASGSISSNDPYSRANPFSFSAGACRSDALQGVIVAPGDQVTLTFKRTSQFGELSAARLTIVAHAGEFCCKPCDANCDGSINQFDITPFVSTLSGTSDPCSPCAADSNLDGSINQFDIQGFVNCLSCD